MEVVLTDPGSSSAGGCLWVTIASPTGRTAIQPDGKIVAGGYGVDYTGPPGEMEYVTKFALGRYTAEGELDLSFGSGGIASVRRGVGDDFGSAVAVAADGRLILAGSYDHNPAPLEEADAPALLRFNPNGSLDPSFGSGGIVLGVSPAGIADEFLEGMALQQDGRILTAAAAYPASGPGSAVVSRYLVAQSAGPLAGPPAPSNAFGFGKVKRNKKAGTAELTVEVPGPGTLVLRGKSVVKKSRVSTRAGKLKLLVESKGGAKRKLGRAGKATVNIKVTFRPDGGVPRTRKKTIKLVERLK